MTLGEKIQKLRSDAGLSQTQLADALTVSRSAIAKWENDNGVPDVDNLRALAAFFRTDLNVLLDDTKEIPSVEVPAAENLPPRPDTYCGKSCEDCQYREALECSGCKAGPGKRFQERCEIARCARSSNIFQCERCVNQLYCSHIKRAEKIPRIHQEELERERIRKERLNRQAPFFGKWIMILFWLMLVGEISGLMTSDLFAAVGPIVLIGNIINFVVALIYGCILIRMSREMNSFYIAGVAMIISDVTTKLVSFFSNGNPAAWTLLLTIPAAIIGLVGVYHECTAFASIMSDVNESISLSWLTIWKIRIWSTAILLIATVLLVVLQVIGLLVIIICSILGVFAGILHIVYLRRTAKAFQTYIP